MGKFANGRNEVRNESRVGRKCIGLRFVLFREKEMKKRIVKVYNKGIVSR
jgi:hypothetical protein